MTQSRPPSLPFASHRSSNLQPCAPWRPSRDTFGSLGGFANTPRSTVKTCRQSPRLRVAHKPHQRRVTAVRSAPSGATAEATTGGGGPGGRGGAGGGGNSSGGDGGSEGWKEDEDVDALLQAAGKMRSNLPSDLAAALVAGSLDPEILKRYLRLSNSLLAPLLNIGPFRERLLADPQFFVKVAIEVGIGIFTKSSAEYAKRGKNFGAELDFVFANVMMALVADFMLVWLPAPTISFGAKKTSASNPLSAFFASCPENAFQKVPPGYPAFSVGQRAGAVARNGVKLLGVGFGASLFGVGITNALIAVRQMLDPHWSSPNAPQDVLALSAAYASYMAVSSNLRYQVIAGVVEERGIEVLFRNSPAACSALSFLVRTSNTFLGSLMWVDYIRLLGFQKAPTH